MKKRMMQLHAETCHYFEFSDTNDVWERLLHEHTLLRVPPPLRPACLPTIYCLKDNFQRRKRLNMKYLFPLSLVFVTHNCRCLCCILCFSLLKTVPNTGCINTQSDIIRDTKITCSSSQRIRRQNGSCSTRTTTLHGNS